MHDIQKRIGGFTSFFGDGEVPRVFFSPGRVNIIGEHLDYNGGLVFPAAISLGIYGVMRPRTDGMVSIRSAGFSDMVSVDVNGPIEADPALPWGNYPRGVIRYLRDSGRSLAGADIYIESTLPDGSGLSSSACLELLTAFMMTRGETRSAKNRIDLALLCRKVENEFIGVNCGIMDQFSIVMGMKDHAILLDAGTLAYEHVPLVLGSHSLVIMNTKKPRKLSDSKYNERRSECEAALELVQKRRPLEHLADASPEDLEAIVDPVVKKRARHVLTENARVRHSVDLLKKGDIISFGKLMDSSHSSLRDDYEVTGPELDAIVSAGRSMEGCIGARMTGAGFGGCAVALVEKNKLDAFIEGVASRYYTTTGIRAECYRCVICDGTDSIQ